jgi:hypothetical protein
MEKTFAEVAVAVNVHVWSFLLTFSPASLFVGDVLKLKTYKK